MKILISEDNDYKYRAIEEVIKEFDSTIEIVRVEYAKGTVLTLMKDNSFDMLIQDMQMPINSDGHIDREGGKYVMSQLKYRGIKIKAIFCSADVVNYPGVESILYDSSSIVWEKTLINFLKN